MFSAIGLIFTEKPYVRRIEKRFSTFNQWMKR